jgi:hypothetical protein
MTSVTAIAASRDDGRGFNAKAQGREGARKYFLNLGVSTSPALDSSELRLCVSALKMYFRADASNRALVASKRSEDGRCAAANPYRVRPAIAGGFLPRVTRSRFIRVCGVVFDGAACPDVARSRFIGVYWG